LSIYKAYAYGKKDIVVNEHPIYKRLTKNEIERSKRYREYISGMMKEKNPMKGEPDRRMLYGNEDFINKITKKYSVEAIIKLRGRPKKEDNTNK
jgi:hypothetical protein